MKTRVALSGKANYSMSMRNFPYFVMGALILFAALILFIVIPVAQEPTKLTPGGWFEVRNSLPESYQQEPLVVREVASDGNFLYFLLYVGRKAKAGLLLHTGMEGNLIKVISTSSRFDTFGVDDQGNLYGYSKAEISVFNTQGTQIRTIPIGQPMLKFCISSGIPVGFWMDGVLRKFEDGIGATQIGVPLGEITSNFYISALGGQKVAILDGAGAKLHITDVNTGTTGSHLLQAPEISEGLAAYPPEELRQANERAVIVYSLTTTRKGDMFVGVTGHSLERGAVVLQLAQDGSVRRTLICDLPVFATLTQSPNPKGIMSPTRIQATEERLYVVDARGYVAFYGR